MELTKQLHDEIDEIFKGVQYGEITFLLSPEKQVLDYIVQTRGRLYKDKSIHTPRPSDKKRPCFP